MLKLTHTVEIQVENLKAEIISMVLLDKISVFQQWWHRVAVKRPQTW